MNKLKLFFIKIGIIPAPPGFKYNPIDRDGDGILQEGTLFARPSSSVKILPKKKAVKKTVKKAPVKKKTAKKAVKKAK